MQDYRYLKRTPRWLCSHVNNFRYVTSSEQLLTKCLPRHCDFLVDLDKLSENERQTYLELLDAKKNGFWICQEKDVTPPPKKDYSKQSTHVNLPNSRPSGQRSKVRCSICLNETDALSNQLLVFCPICDVPFTNQLALEEEL